MKFFIGFILFIMSSLGFTKTNCIYLVGDGNFFKPQIETRFVKNYVRVKDSWSECADSKKLLSLGTHSFIYNEHLNHYEKISSSLVDDEASRDNFYNSVVENIEKLKSKDTLRLYLGDHGYQWGSLASDGTIKPAELQKLLKLGKEKGLKLEGVFDHCYSGNMLSSFYDLESKEVYGCAMSTANDKVSYTNEDVSDRDFIHKKTIYSQAFLGSNTKKTLLLATSDRFLLDYAKKYALSNQPICCEFGKIESSYGFSSQAFDKIAYKDVYDEIARLESNLKLAIRNSKKIYKDIDFSGKDPKGSPNAWEEYSKILRETRAMFLKEAKKDPAWLAIFTEKDRLYESLVDCRNEKKFPIAAECPDYVRYTLLSNQIEKGLNDFNSKTKVKNAYGLSPAFDKSHQTLSLKSQINLALTKFNTTRIAEQFNEKKELYASKKLALLQMMKTNDTKAIKAFMELRACEQNTSL